MFKKRKGETAGRKIFSRASFLGFGWRHDLIARDYMERWTFSTPFGAVRLHKIMRSDDRVALHDHPMDFVSIILKGGYKEHRYAAGPRWYFPGDVNVKRAEDLHALELLEEGEPTWTLVFALPFRRDWGFMTPDEGWVPAGEYDAWKERCEKRVCGARNDLNERRCALRAGHDCPHLSEGLSWSDEPGPCQTDPGTALEIHLCDYSTCKKVAVTMDWDDDEGPTPRCEEHRLRAEAKVARYVEDFGDEELRRVADGPCTCDALSASLQQCGCVCNSCAARVETGRRRVAAKEVKAG